MRGFSLTNEIIKILKITITTLLGLLWLLLMTVWASNPIETASQQYVTAVNAPTLATMPQVASLIEKRYIPTGNGQCVDFVKNNGFSGYSGNAYEWAKYVNSEIGWPGYAVLLDEGPYQHLALIIEIREDGYYIVEQNFIGLYIVSYRTIAFDYTRIEGFIRP